MNYSLAKSIDKQQIANLIHLEIEDFPGLDADEMESRLGTMIKNGDVILSRTVDDISGVLLFDRKTGEVFFMAVDPIYRGKGIARAMFSYMTSLVPKDKEIYTYSYRPDDDASTGAERFFIDKLGFKPRAYVEREGIPVQQYIYKR